MSGLDTSRITVDFYRRTVMRLLAIREEHPQLYLECRQRLDAAYAVAQQTDSVAPLAEYRRQRRSVRMTHPLSTVPPKTGAGRGHAKTHGFGTCNFTIR